MFDGITINLSPGRDAECFICETHGDHRHAVSVDECGGATSRETGVCKITCEACHDTIYPINE